MTTTKKAVNIMKARELKGGELKLEDAGGVGFSVQTANGDMLLLLSPTIFVRLLRNEEKK